MAKREFQIQSVRVAIGLLRNFPFPNCFTNNRASNFFGNFWKFPGNFNGTVSLEIGLESE